jgi:hypothetical protein
MPVDLPYSIVAQIARLGLLIQQVPGNGQCGFHGASLLFPGGTISNMRAQISAAILSDTKRFGQIILGTAHRTRPSSTGSAGRVRVVSEKVMLQKWAEAAHVQAFAVRKGQNKSILCGKGTWFDTRVCGEALAIVGTKKRGSDTRCFITQPQPGHGRAWTTTCYCATEGNPLNRATVSDLSKVRPGDLLLGYNALNHLCAMIPMQFALKKARSANNDDGGRGGGGDSDGGGDGGGDGNFPSPLRQPQLKQPPRRQEKTAVTGASSKTTRGPASKASKTADDAMLPTDEAAMIRAQEEKDARINLAWQEANSVIPCVIEQLSSRRENAAAVLERLRKSEAQTTFRWASRGGFSASCTALIAVWQDTTRSMPVAVAVTTQQPRTPCATAVVEAFIAGIHGCRLLALHVEASARDHLRRSSGLAYRGQGVHTDGEASLTNDREMSSKAVRAIQGSARGRSDETKDLTTKEARPCDFAEDVSQVAALLRRKEISTDQMQVFAIVLSTPRSNQTPSKSHVKCDMFESEQRGPPFDRRWSYFPRGLSGTVQNITKCFDIQPATTVDYCLNEHVDVYYSNSKAAIVDRALSNASRWQRFGAMDASMRDWIRKTMVGKWDDVNVVGQHGGARTRVRKAIVTACANAPFSPASCVCGDGCWLAKRGEASVAICPGVAPATFLTTAGFAISRLETMAYLYGAGTEAKPSSARRSLSSDHSVPDSLKLTCDRCQNRCNCRQMIFVVAPPPLEYVVLCSACFDKSTDTVWKPTAVEAGCNMNTAGDRGAGGGLGDMGDIDDAEDHEFESADFAGDRFRKLAHFVELLEAAFASLENRSPTRKSLDDKKLAAFRLYVSNLVQGTGGMLMMVARACRGKHQEDAISLILTSYDYTNGKPSCEAWPDVVPLERSGGKDIDVPCRCDAHNQGHTDHWIGHIRGYCFHQLCAFALTGCSPEFETAKLSYEDEEEDEEEEEEEEEETDDGEEAQTQLIFPSCDEAVLKQHNGENTHERSHRAKTLGLPNSWECLEKEAAHFSVVESGDVDTTVVRMIDRQHKHLRTLVFVSCSMLGSDTSSSPQALVSVSAEQMKCSITGHSSRRRGKGGNGGGCTHTAAVMSAVATKDIVIAPRDMPPPTDDSDDAGMNFERGDTRAGKRKPEAVFNPQLAAWEVKKENLSDKVSKSNLQSLRYIDAKGTARARTGTQGIESSVLDPALLVAASTRPRCRSPADDEHKGDLDDHDDAHPIDDLVLKAALPDPTTTTCGCGAGWSSASHPSGIEERTNQSTTVVFFNGTATAQLVNRRCLALAEPKRTLLHAPCTLEPSGEEQKIHRVTATSAVAHEVLHWSLEQMETYNTWKSTALRASLLFQHRCNAGGGNANLELEKVHWDATLRHALYGFIARQRLDYRIACPLCPRKDFRYTTPVECMSQDDPTHDRDACLWSHSAGEVKVGTYWYGTWLTCDGKVMSLRRSRMHVDERWRSHTVTKGDAQPIHTVKNSGSAHRTLLSGLVDPTVRLRMKALAKRQCGVPLEAAEKAAVNSSAFVLSGEDLSTVRQATQPDSMWPFIEEGLVKHGKAMDRVVAAAKAKTTEKEKAAREDCGGEVKGGDKEVAAAKDEFDMKCNPEIRELCVRNTESKYVLATMAFIREFVAKRTQITDLIPAVQVPYLKRLLALFTPGCRGVAPMQLRRVLRNSNARFLQCIVDLFLASPKIPGRSGSRTRGGQGDDLTLIAPPQIMLDCLAGLLIRRAEVCAMLDRESYHATTPADDVYSIDPRWNNPSETGGSSNFNNVGVPLRPYPVFSHIKDAAHPGRAECQKPDWSAGAGKNGNGTFSFFCEHGFCQYNTLMTSHESSKDAVVPLFTDLVKLNPKLIIVSDMSCKHSIYCDNRYGSYFSSVHFLVDKFHCAGHNCSSTYDYRKYHDLPSGNTSLIEQTHSHTNMLSYVAAQMLQGNFLLLWIHQLYRFTQKKKDALRLKNVLVYEDNDVLLKKRPRSDGLDDAKDAGGGEGGGGRGGGGREAMDIVDEGSTDATSSASSSSSCSSSAADAATGSGMVECECRKPPTPSAEESVDIYVGTYNHYSTLS